MLIEFNSGHGQEAENLLKKNSLSRGPETPPNSGIRGNNVHISFRKAKHVPTPFLVLVNCSVAIVAAQSLQLGAVSENFQFYLS